MGFLLVLLLERFGSIELPSVQLRGREGVCGCWFMNSFGCAAYGDDAQFKGVHEPGDDFAFFCSYLD